MKFIKSWIKILSLTSRCEMQNNQHYCACAMTLEYIGLMTSRDGNKAGKVLVVLFLFSLYCIKSIFSHPNNQMILDKMFLCLNLIENNTLNLHLSRYLLEVGLAMMYIVKCPENAFSQGISVLCVKLSFKSLFLSVKQIRLQSHLQIFYFCLYILQLFYFKKIFLGVCWNNC